MQKQEVKYISITKDKALCPDSVYFKKSRLIALETTAESAMAGIYKIIYDDRCFFMIDNRRQAVFVFKEDGTFLRRIQHLGRGPGEYTRINGFTLNPQKKQIIISSDTKRLLYYDYYGKSMGEESLSCPFREIGYDGTSLIATVSEIESTERAYCYKVSDKGKLEAALLKYTSLPYTNQYAQGTFLTKTEKLRVTNRYDRSINTVKHGQLIRDYEIDFGKYNLPESLITPNVDPQVLMKACDEGKYVYTITNASDYGHYLFFSTNLSGFFVYDKETDLLHKYESIFDTTIETSFNNFQPVENLTSTAAFVMLPSLHIPSLKAAKALGAYISPKTEEAFLYEFR